MLDYLQLLQLSLPISLQRDLKKATNRSKETDRDTSLAC